MAVSNTPTRPIVATERELADWLTYASMEIDRRWEELIVALRATIEAHPAIADGDEDTAGVFTENIRMVAALRAVIVEFHKREKAPYWTRGKQVDGWMNALTEAIDRHVEPLRSALRDFTIRRDRARIFADKEPVRGIYGSTASLKETWDYEVEDITKVPAEYLEVNKAMVRAVLMDRDPKTKVPRRTIPGIRWVKNKNLAVS